MFKLFSFPYCIPVVHSIFIVEFEDLEGLREAMLSKSCMLVQVVILNIACQLRTCMSVGAERYLKRFICVIGFQMHVVDCFHYFVGNEIP